MKKIIFILMCFIALGSLTAQAQDTIEGDSVSVSFSEFGEELTTVGEFTKAAADSAYVADDFRKAIRIYEELLENGENAVIYYNLGNSYYKDEQIGRAILNYERALLLEPGNKDIRANLEIAQSKTVDKVEIIPEVFFMTWIHNLINCLSADNWGKVAILFFLLFLAGICLFIFSGKVGLKKVGFTCAVISITFVIVSNIFAYQQKGKLINRTEAIVMNPSITITSTPNENGTSLFILHEGRKVTIKDNSMNEWKEIMLEDGNVGWIPAKAIEII